MAERLILLEPRQNAPKHSGSGAIPPIWRLGFRPFFLFGAIFGLIGISLWIALSAGWLPQTLQWQPLGGWLGWHRHEMPFGFVMAIIAGFLLTVIQNWTGQPSLSGRPLMFLFAMWAAARLSWLLGAPWQWTVLPELAFIFLLAFFSGRLLWAARQSHNYSAPGTIFLVGLADIESLAGVATGNDAWQTNGAMAVIWLIVALMTMIGGRVIPFFTQRGLGRPKARTVPLRLDMGLMIAALLLAALAACGLGAQPGWPFAVLFAALAAAHLYRLWRWYDQGVWSVPLLWSLHVPCLWMAVGFTGLAAYHAGWLASSSTGLHALTVGAMGGLILAMTARVSLGHTGRPLKASRGMALAFVLIHLGAAARVFSAPWFPLPGLIAASLCWLLAFGLFAATYAPILCRPRADGEPG